MTTNNKCYVVERQETQIAKTTIEGVWDKQEISKTFVYSELESDKQVIQDVEPDINLEIIESSCSDPRQTYYYLGDQDGNQYVGYYITEVPKYEN